MTITCQDRASQRRPGQYQPGLCQPSQGRRAVLLSLLAALASLSGCGGGGSGGSGGGSVGGSQPHIVASVSSLNVAAAASDAAPVATFTVSVVNATGNTIYVAVGSAGGAISTVNWAPSGTDALVTATMLSPSQLTVGSYTDVITFTACADNACQHPLQGSPLTIPVTYKITASTLVATVTPASITTTQVLSDASYDITFNLTVDLSQPLGFVPIASAEGVSNLVGVFASQTSPTQLNLNVGLRGPGTELTVGTHLSTLIVHLCAQPNCPNDVATLHIPVTYIVLDWGSDPTLQLVPLPQATPLVLTHNVIDAGYSAPLDAIVMVSSSPANALYLFRTATQTEVRLDLAQVPTELSISPDGQHALIAHAQFLSAVNLATVGQAGATATLVATGFPATHLALDNAGYAYVTSDSTTTTASDLYAVNLATGVATASTSYSSQQRMRLKLHPSRPRIYAVTGAITPGGVYEFDTSSLPVAAVPVTGFSLPGYIPQYSNLWLNQTGSQVYVDRGNVFTTSATPAQDLVSPGTLTLADDMLYGYRIASLSENDAAHEIALVEYDWYNCQTDIWPTLEHCQTHVATYDSATLARGTVYSIDPVTVNFSTLKQRGMFTFHNAAGTQHWLISAAGPPGTPASAYLLSRF